MLVECSFRGEIMPHYEIHPGKKQNRIDLYFEEKPSRDVLDRLKSNNWKWHNQNKCWYTWASQDHIDEAEDICNCDDGYIENDFEEDNENNDFIPYYNEEDGRLILCLKSSDERRLRRELLSKGWTYDKEELYWYMDYYSRYDLAYAKKLTNSVSLDDATWMYEKKEWEEEEQEKLRKEMKQFEYEERRMWRYVNAGTNWKSFGYSGGRCSPR